MIPTPPRWTAGHTALTIGVLVSAAMQIAYSEPHGWVRLIAGLAAVAVVPGGMHLWPHIPITGRWTRAARAVAVSGVVLAAMIVNGAHAVILLTSRGEQLALAVLIVVAVESLMVMASLATRAHPVQGSRPNLEFGAPEFKVPDIDDLDLVDLYDPLAGDGREGHPAPTEVLSKIHAEHVEAMRARIEELNPRDRMRLVPTIDPTPEPATGGNYYDRALAAYASAVESADGNAPEVTIKWVEQVTGCSTPTAKRVRRRLLAEIEAVAE